MNIVGYGGKLNMVLVFPDVQEVCNDTRRQNTGNVRIVDIFSFIVRGTAIYIESVIDKSGELKSMEASFFCGIDDLVSINL